MSISRPDEHGFQVRVRRSGRLYSRYFGVTRYGGVRAAKAVARAYEARLLAMPKETAPRPASRERVKPMEGISLVRYRKRSKNLTVYDYKVHYYDAANGKRKVKTFYVGTEATFTRRKAAVVLEAARRFRDARDRDWRRAARAR
jgi:hypothetical protein